jgi:hypothetical protein
MRRRTNGNIARLLDGAGIADGVRGGEDDVVRSGLRLSRSDIELFFQVHYSFKFPAH